MQKLVEQALSAQKDIADWQLEQWKLMESHTVQVLDFSRKSLELGLKSWSASTKAFSDSLDNSDS